jgi:hypothetical protein
MRSGTGFVFFANPVRIPGKQIITGILRVPDKDKPGQCFFGPPREEYLKQLCN